LWREASGPVVVLKQQFAEVLVFGHLPPQSLLQQLSWSVSARSDARTWTKPRIYGPEAARTWQWNLVCRTFETQGTGVRRVSNCFGFAFSRVFHSRALLPRVERLLRKTQHPAGHHDRHPDWGIWCGKVKDQRVGLFWVNIPNK
jgi:hypothetical protein